MYAGELNKAMEKGDIMGHEAIGFVEKVGSQVRSLIAGDKVIICRSSPVGNATTASKKSTLG